MRLISSAEPGCHQNQKPVDTASLQNARHNSPQNQTQDHPSAVEGLAQVFGHDTLVISKETITLKRAEDDAATASGRPCCANAAADQGKSGQGAMKEERGKALAANEELSTEEQREVQHLRARDREVRAHEQAHVAASGRIAVSGPRYSYEEGPDGRRYATGGTVNFQVPPANSPEEEARLAAQLRRMALAPANPSGTDRAVAASASAKESQARREAYKQKMEETSEARADATTAEQPAQQNAKASEKSKAVDIYESKLSPAEISKPRPPGQTEQIEYGVSSALTKAITGQAYNNATGLLRDNHLVNFIA